MRCRISASEKTFDSLSMVCSGLQFQVNPLPCASLTAVRLGQSDNVLDSHWFSVPHPDLHFVSELGCISTDAELNSAGIGSRFSVPKRAASEQLPNGCRHTFCMQNADRHLEPRRIRDAVGTMDLTFAEFCSRKLAPKMLHSVQYPYVVSIWGSANHPAQACRTHVQ